MDNNRKRKILIGYDHSKVSNNAMEWIVNKKIIFPEDDITLAIIINDDAISIEGTFGLESSIIGPAGWLQSDEYKDRISEIEKESIQELKYVINWFKNKGFNINPKVLGGEPGETLKDFAEANDTDLVIVGSRGLGFFKRQLIGSVSDYLTHNLKCSLLVVKDDHPTHTTITNE